MHQHPTKAWQKVAAHLALAVAVAVVLAVFAFPAFSGPYDNTRTRPGTTIENRAVITWGRPGVHPDPIHISNDLLVLPHSTPSTLKLFRYAPGDPKAIQVPVSRPMFATRHAPVSNFSASQDPGAEIDLSAEIPLVETDRILDNADVFIILNNQGRNFDSRVRDSLLVDVQDIETGDREILRLFETGPDTGLFAGWICACAEATTPGDGLLSTTPHSRIDVVHQDPWRPDLQLEGMVMVGPLDPSGLLFDSRTGAPLSGVEVTLIDARTGSPAKVQGEDLETTYPATITTGAEVVDSSGRRYKLSEGEYRFPFVDEGTYRLQLSPPRGYIAPSTAETEKLQALPGSPFSLVAGSRLETFDVAAGQNLRIDIPLDGSALIDVTRSGSSDQLTAGEAILYTVSIGTNVEGPLEVDLLDILPPSARIERPSVKINGKPAAGRTDLSPDGTRITFSDVMIPKGGRAIVTYVARITLAAGDNEAIETSSTAQAAGFLSNTAHHLLKISPAFDTDSTVLLGQVFGTGCASSFDPEIDLSGIRVYLENGRYAETDEAGLFTFRNLPSGAHVLHLDELSLPRGYVPTLCENSTRRAGSPSSAFVQARGGFADQVYFHLAASETPATSRPPHEAVAAQRRVYDLNRAWLEQAAPDPGIVFPVEGYLPRTKSLELGVVRGAGQSISVRLNGEEVPAIHRRPSIADGAGKVFLDVWTGAQLASGKNLVEIEIRSEDGSLLLQDATTISYNDVVDRLEVIEHESELETDGRTRPRIVFRPQDREGIPLHPGTIVTISVDPPFALIPEDPGEPPVRRRTAQIDPDGSFRLDLAPVRASGKARFYMEGQDGQVDASAYISAASRPWLVIGLAEGTAAHASVARHMQGPEQVDLGALGPLRLSGRTALFAEGVIAGKWLTTLRYDSGIGEEQDFFAPDPDAQYIVYGDDSTEGDAAQSRHKLYLRLKSEEVDALYGDFGTDLAVGPTAYSRKLTGGRVLFGKDTATIEAFAASTSQVFQHAAFPANGTSGPFDLEHADIVPFSEEIRVETASRTDPEKIVDTMTLARGTDYDIDYRTGRIFLAEPLLARDSELNTHAIIVDYETDPDGSDGVLLGGRLSLRLSDRVEAGISAVRESHVAGTDGAGHLYGVDASLALADDWSLRAGLAQSGQDASNTLESPVSAHSAEVSLIRDIEDGELEIYARSQDSSFGIDNQRAADESDHLASLGARLAMTLSADQRPGPDGPEEISSLRLEAEGKAERNLDTGARRNSAEAMLSRREGALERGVGLRMETLSAGAGAPVSSYLKALGAVQWHSEDERLSLGLGQEITLARSPNEAEVDRGTVEASYKLSERLTFKASNETAQGPRGRANIFSLGADIEPWKGAIMTLGGLRANSETTSLSVAHAGMDQAFDIISDWTLKTGLHTQDAISDADEGPIALAGLSNPRISEGYTTLTLGAERSFDRWTLGGDFERRLSEGGRGDRLSFSASGNPGEDRDFGLKASFYDEVAADGIRKRDHVVKASLAHRPVDRRLAWLGQIEARFESEGDSARGAALGTIYHTREIAPGRNLNLRYGIKYTAFDHDGETYADLLNLVGAEYRQDLSDVLDFGLHGSVMHSASSRTLRQSLGASIGFTPFDNGWVSIGYNIAGFRDDDFSAHGYTDAGAFLQFRWKIDSDSITSLLRRD